MNRVEAATAAPRAPAFLRIEGLSLDFPIYHGGARSLKKTVLSAASGRLGPARTAAGSPAAGAPKPSTGRVVVQALRDITVSLVSGDRLGIVGANGAGKSSLLRAMAGIYEPACGRVHVGGTLNALLDPNLGMNLDLTGRENIVLRGRYVGLGSAAIRDLEDDVQAFAALGEFLDLPVRTYSSGMVVRLGFGLATAIAPQVLLMDEWFMAGDSAFQDKGACQAGKRGARSGDPGADLAHGQRAQDLVHARALVGRRPCPRRRAGGRGDRALSAIGREHGTWVGHSGLIRSGRRPGHLYAFGWFTTDAPHRRSRSVRPTVRTARPRAASWSGPAAGSTTPPPHSR